MAPADRAVRQSFVERARSALGEHGWAEAWSTGDTTNMDDIRALVRAENSEQRAPHQVSADG